MGTGMYIERSCPGHMKALSLDKLAELLTSEIINGVTDRNIKAGFIGEIGISSFSDTERKVLAAASIAQKNTGAALVVHQPGLSRRADEILDVI